MQELSFVVFQVAEARRYINEEHIEGLRLALVLLDNAIELQMERRIGSDFVHERIRESILAMEQSLPEGYRSSDDDGWEPLSNNQRRAIERTFDAKVDYLSERTQHLDPALGRSIKYLHKYRNEAYHTGRVRDDTILTATKIALELNCHLLLSLPIGVMRHAYGEETWLKREFGLQSPTGLMSRGTEMERIVSALRSGVLDEPRLISDLLSDHLLGRLAEFRDLLEYVGDETAIGDAAAALRFTQYRADAKAGRVGLTKADVDAYEASRDLSYLAELEERSQLLRDLDDRIQAFEAFSLLEEEFEPLEAELFDFVHEVDAWINAKIDEIRGK